MSRIESHWLIACLLLCAGCKGKPAGQPAPQRPAAGDIGLDHVGLAVHDLAEARRTFVDDLGFGGFQASKLANGTGNLVYYFEDGTYLETFTDSDARTNGWLPADSPPGERLAFFALATASLDATSRALQANGVGSGPQVAEGGEERPARWRTMFPLGGPLPAGAWFFISYAQPERAEHLRKLEEARRSGRIYRHPNGARGLKAVWLAVRDLEATASQLEKLGYLAGATATIPPQLAARGRFVDLAEGRLLLLTPVAEGPVDALLRARGESLCGLSIEVANLGVAQHLAARATGIHAPEVAGPSGRAMLLEPARAHGAWLELYQR